MDVCESVSTVLLDVSKVKMSHFRSAGVFHETALKQNSSPIFTGYFYLKADPKQENMGLSKNTRCPKGKGSFWVKGTKTPEKPLVMVPIPGHGPQPQGP